MLRVLTGSLVALLVSAAPATMTPPSGGVWPQPGKCSSIDPAGQRRCIGRRVEAKNKLVDQLYPKALATVRAGAVKWGGNDRRTDPRNFTAAHQDWRRFIASNCRALGAIGGGSNSAISDRITACYERELDGRIQLYRQIAAGTYGL